MPSIGLNYQPELREFFASNLSLIDYVEIVPDIAWTSGENTRTGYGHDPETVDFLDGVQKERPLVAHSIGLSIGSAHRLRVEHLAQMAEWDTKYDFLWHSDHVGYNVVLGPDGEEFTVGVPLPFAFSEEMLQLIVGRVGSVRERIDKPFLLELNSAYVRVDEDDYTMAAFMNRLCAESGCGVLLDLHNIYTDWRNGLEDIDAFLAELDLTNVVEVHLAGGLEYGDHYLDAHSGAVPDDVWSIASDLLPACPNLRGVTFELLGSWYKRMGEGPLQETLIRMRETAP